MFNYNKKPPKTKCEVCGESNVKVLDLHHIIPRTDPNCTNNGMNLAVLCSNCHRKHHAGDLEVLGVYPSTSGRVLVYILNGVKNLDVDIPYYTPKNKEVKVSYDKTVRSNGNEQEFDKEIKSKDNT